MNCLILDCSNAYENKDKEFVDACNQGCTNEKEAGREQVITMLSEIFITVLQ